MQAEFDGLVDLIAGVLSPEEQQSMEELHQYMLEDEGSWALGDGFLNFVGKKTPTSTNFIIVPIKRNKLFISIENFPVN